MISFYPGPSRVHDEIPAYVKDAFRQGIMSINHRSDTFMAISERCITLLKAKLGIPTDYTVFYTSSATECWEIIAQSVITSGSHHLFNGAFGEKWFQYTRRIREGAIEHRFDINEIPDASQLRFSDEGVICITQNETSNGTQLHNTFIDTVRKNNPRHLVAVDATSSMAGIALNFNAADIWFASVQKCFGLPAGLGLMVCSPRAMAHVKSVGERNHYNSLLFMDEMMEKWQTPFTPNVLNIYLLMRVMDARPAIADIDGKTKRRYQRWMTFLSEFANMNHLVANTSAHSWTVIPVTTNGLDIPGIRTKAKEQGFLLGEGYGSLKSSTFRIANFPAIRNVEIRQLQQFLRTIGG